VVGRRFLRSDRSSEPTGQQSRDIPAHLGIPTCVRRSWSVDSGFHDDLEDLALIPRPVAVGHRVEVREAVEDPARFAPAFKNVR
jgi:hypothetical protein